MLLKLFVFLVLTGIFINACPPGSVPTATNNEMCYTWTKETVDGSYDVANYDEADLKCTLKGGNLATIPNEKENWHLFGLLANEEISDACFWIGIHIRDGKWEWEDGTPVNYYYWGTHKPSNDCGCYDRKSGMWQTAGCDTELNYICLIPCNSSMARSISVFVTAILVIVPYMYLF